MRSTTRSRRVRTRGAAHVDRRWAVRADAGCHLTGRGAEQRMCGSVHARGVRCASTGARCAASLPAGFRMLRGSLARGRRRLALRAGRRLRVTALTTIVVASGREPRRAALRPRFRSTVARSTVIGGLIGVVRRHGVPFRRGDGAGERQTPGRGRAAGRPRSSARRPAPACPSPHLICWPVRQPVWR